MRPAQARPVRWLLDNLEVDGRWTFVHATHVDAGEVTGMVGRGVVVGLCPLTEANLGDGLFPLANFHRSGGAWGVGTDANTVVGVADELRMLDYGQRLFHRRRDILAADAASAGYSPGRVHYEVALAGGASSLCGLRSRLSGKGGASTAGPFFAASRSATYRNTSPIERSEAS